jgi:replicative DNA helicase
MQARDNVLRIDGARARGTSFDEQHAAIRAAPCNIDAEQALLGAILIDNAALARVVDFLAPHHFHDPLHQQIYESTAKQIAEGRLASPITLRTLFEAAPPIEAGLTVPQYLGRLVANATTTINAEQYGRTIYDLAVRRHLILVGEDMLDGAYDPRQPVPDLLRSSAGELKIVEAAASVGSAPPVIARRVDEILATALTWLWPQRLALGKLALIAGEPGAGKSQLSCRFAAAVSTGGTWPDGSSAPRGSVVLICCEDDAADTIRPRLEAAGADLSRVHILDWVAKSGIRQHFSVGADVDALSALLKSIGDVRLIIIDPISAYMGRADSHVVADVRQALAPIQSMAAELGPAVVLISHLNKNSGAGAMARVSGSGAFVAVVRSAWLVAVDPEDSDRRRRVLAPLKNNLGDDRTGFAYRIEPWHRDDIASSLVVFEAGIVTTTANDLLDRGRRGGDNDANSALADAEAFLQSELADGPKASSKVDKAARDAGISPASLRRARKALGVRSRKDGSGAWHIQLPPPARGTSDE